MNSMLVNGIAITVIVIAVVFAVKGSIPHFKGQGSCCGGGGSLTLVKPKRLKKVVAVRTIVIEGMTCDHCSGRIHNALNSIEGVSAKVSRARGLATVKLDREPDNELLRRTVEELGYRVLQIR